jgi:hypothetical protein
MRCASWRRSRPMLTHSLVMSACVNYKRTPQFGVSERERAKNGHRPRETEKGDRLGVRSSRTLRFDSFGAARQPAGELSLHCVRRLAARRATPDKEDSNYLLSSSAGGLRAPVVSSTVDSPPAALALAAAAAIGLHKKARGHDTGERAGEPANKRKRTQQVACRAKLINLDAFCVCARVIYLPT